MDQTTERPLFNAKPTIEQTPFKFDINQSFLAEWARINDNLVPHFEPREDWEKRTGSLLEDTPDGKKTIHIPTDLKIWEMVGIMEVVDHDTYRNKPELRDKKKKELMVLGENFKNAGVYIAQRLDAIHEGKFMANALAEEFYDFGQSLVTGTKPDQSAKATDIATHTLTDEDVDRVDRFLAGDSLFASRFQKAQRLAAQDPAHESEIFEKTRTDALAQFFRVTHKAKYFDEVEIESDDFQYLRDRTDLDPWASTTPIHRAFLSKIRDGVKDLYTRPYVELQSSFFRRGMELLRTTMPKPDRLSAHYWGNYSDLDHDTRILWEALRLDVKRARLSQLKQGIFDDATEIRHLSEFMLVELQLERKYGDGAKWGETLQIIRSNDESDPQSDDPRAKIERMKTQNLLTDNEYKRLTVEFSLPAIISREEIRLARQIQKETQSYMYKDIGDNPAAMVNTGEINCLGSVMVAAALFEELGLKWLPVLVPKHVQMMLVTEDQHVFWMDMLDAGKFLQLTDDMILKQENQSKVSVSDIARFASHPSSDGIRVRLTRDSYERNVPSEILHCPDYVTILNPEVGLEATLLSNLAGIFNNEMISLPKTDEFFPHIDELAYYSRRAAEAALQLCPDSHASAVVGYAIILKNNKHWTEAKGALKKYIRLESRSPYAYYLLGGVYENQGRTAKAIASYNKALKYEKYDIEKTKICPMVRDAIQRLTSPAA